MEELLQSLWLWEKLSKVWMTVWMYGQSSAAKIWSLCWYERTHAYKLLKQLVELDLIQETQRWSVTHYYISWKSVLKEYLQKQTRDIELKKQQLLEKEHLLDDMKLYDEWIIPPLRVWTWVQWVGQWLNDIIQTCEGEWRKGVLMYWSQTLESLSTSTRTFSEQWSHFFSHMQKRDITLSWSTWVWWLVLDKIISWVSLEELKQLPTWRRSLNLFVVWNHTYILFFRREPVLLKIVNEELSELVRVLFEQKIRN